jgi:hypothetical protein
VIRISSSERSHAGYRYGPALIDVEADDADAARWLEEFLTPWFEVTAAGKSDFAVRLTRSAPAFADLEHRRAAAPLRTRACFALDSRVVELPGWAEDGATVIADSECSCFYRVRRRSVEVVAAPGIRRARVGLMRVVRELAAARMLQQQSILDLHAAAFAVGERTVLLVGPRRAGKTTLLVHALASGRASLLANDRVFVDASRDPGRGFGAPTLVSLRADTLRWFPSLQRGSRERPALLHAAELASHDGGAFSDGVVPRFGLSPAQLARRLGAEIVPAAPIAAIVFPEICPETVTWSLDIVAPGDGTARLRESLYGARSGSRPRTIFDEMVGGRSPCAQEQETLAARLAARLPLFRCRLGGLAYRDGADAWLRALPLDPAGGGYVA